MSETVDLLLHPDWLLSMAADAGAVSGHSLAISGDHIAAVGPRAELAARFDARTQIELPNRLLLPGLINAHTHAAMTLLRGVGEDQPLQPWLFEHIWPAEQRLVGEDFVAFGTRLAIAEMLRSGTTCFADMYFFPEVVAREATRAGIRAQLAFPIIEQANPWCADLDEAFRKGLALHDTYRDDRLIRVAFGPHSAYAVSETALARVLTYAEELDLKIQMHVHENAVEVEDARPLAALDRLGLLNPSLQAVHMTQLTAQEIERVAATGVSVVHCPASNMKLASGACPTRDLLDAGIPVALGTDGAASSNSLDMLQAARLMALLAKHETGAADALRAREALEAATLGGARALGVDDRLGSLEPGKLADAVAIDLTHPAMLPLIDPVSQLVHTEAGGKVTEVWVGGEQVVEQGALLTIDGAALVEGAALWTERLRA
ncbi:MAG: TRZ/ATZ family hydrolase [Pseudomonadota bacterium]